MNLADTNTESPQLYQGKDVFEHPCAVRDDGASSNGVVLPSRPYDYGRMFVPDEESTSIRASGAGDGESNVVIRWLDREVRSRLISLDEKLEVVAQDVKQYNGRSSSKACSNNGHADVHLGEPKRARQSRQVTLSEQKLRFALLSRQGAPRKTHVASTPRRSRETETFRMSAAGEAAPQQHDHELRSPRDDYFWAERDSASISIAACASTSNMSKLPSVQFCPSTCTQLTLVEADDDEVSADTPINEAEDEDNHRKHRKTRITSRPGTARNSLVFRMSVPKVFFGGGWWLSEMVWRFLDDVESSRAAFVYAQGMHAFLLAAFGLVLVEESIKDPSQMQKNLAAGFEIFVDIVCMAEVAVRYTVCPNKRNFWFSTYSWIDIIVAFPPFIMRAAIGFTLPDEDTPEKMILLSFVPTFRLLKMLRHFEQFRLLLNAFELAFEALPVLLYMLLMITLTASSAIYVLEPRSNIASLPGAIWLSVATISTVGYGDVYPVTSEGSTCIIILMIISVLYMAMPIGIIGGAFLQVWTDRDRILLVQRTRDRLTKWGYTPEQIPILFETADGDGTGELDIDEFQHLIENMRIGLSQERIAMLFNSFDEDGSGLIDAQEFVRNIFPGHYLSLFNAKVADDGDEETST